MLYFFADRREWLKLLPPGGRWAEIGVFKGDNAARLLEVCAPKELHLIDPWRFELDFDWFDPPAWSPLWGDAAKLVRQLSSWAGVPAGQHVNEHFERLHHEVRARFQNDPRVTIHRATSRDAAKQFPNGYFDFVYVDGAHDYQAVLADLHLYDPKLGAGGVLMGDDFCEHGAHENAEYGVIAAVAKFLKRTGPRMLVANNEHFSFFALLRPEQPAGAALLKRMVDSGIYFVELPDSLAANYHHKFLQRSDGSVRYLPSF